MNPELWVAIVFLLAIAFLIVIPPLFRRNQTQASDVAQQNITIARQKLEELKAQLAAGDIDQAQFDVQELELETALNDDLSLSPGEKQVENQGRWMIALLLILLPTLLITMYKVYGDPEALNRKTTVAAAPEAKQSLGSVDQMVAALEQRMQQNPNDVEGWVMLGRSYKYLKQYDKSVQAYKTAYELNNQDPELMLQYADALVMANGGKFDDQSKSLIFKALEVAPENITALWLAGIYKAETGDLVSGVKYLADAQSQFPPDSDSYQELKQYITSVIGHMSDEQKKQVQHIAEAQQQMPVTATTAQPQLNVAVNLSSELAGKVAPDDVVFVYATALSGPQMPLAIVRKQVKDLPLKVKLSDQQAMSPAMKLSNFQDVAITARVSKSGKAMKQPGDLIGLLKPVSVAEQGVLAVEIDQVLSDLSAPVKSSAPTPAAVKAQPATTGRTGIHVNVDLSPHLKNRVKASDTVFIYAQASSGPKMPLAIVRKTVQDLPVEVELSDAQAMSPAMKLSGFDQVRVIARISQSGQAMKQPGDLISMVDDVSVKDNSTVAVVISQVVK